MVAKGGEDVTLDRVRRIVDFPISWRDRYRAPYAAVHSLGDIEQMALGMKDIDRLDGIGEEFLCQPSNPSRSVAENYASLGLAKAAAFGFAEDAPSEGCGSRCCFSLYFGTFFPKYTVRVSRNAP